MKFPIFTRTIALMLSVLAVFYLLPSRAYAAIGDDGEIAATVNTSDGTGNYYTYDELGRTTGVRPVSYTAASNTVAADQNAESVSYAYDSRGNLSSISTESTTYLFSYDLFGNSYTVAVGDRVLAEYEYNDYNGKLKKSLYSNGLTVEYVYDEREQLSEIWYVKGSSRTKAFEYFYTEDGRLSHYKKDGTTAESYLYDANGRITSVVNTNRYSIGYVYDDHGKLVGADYDDLAYCFGYYYSMSRSLSYEGDRLV